MINHNDEEERDVILVPIERVLRENQLKPINMIEAPVGLGMSELMSRTHSPLLSYSPIEGDSDKASKDTKTSKKKDKKKKTGSEKLETLELEYVKLLQRLSPGVISEMSEKEKEIYAVANNWKFIKLFKRPSESTCITAITINPKALKHIKNPTYAMCILAYNANKDTAKYIPKNFKWILKR